MKTLRTWLFPLIALLSAAALGGSTGLYIKKIAYSGFVLTGFRMVVPVLVLLPFIIRRKQFPGPAEQRKKIWLASLVNVGRMLFFISAYKYTSITNAVVLFYLWPVFALILSYFIRRKIPRPLELSIILAAFGGVIVMNLHKDFSLASKDLIGTLFIIAAALLYAVYVVITKSALSSTSIGTVIFYQNFLGAIVYLPFFISAFTRPVLIDISISLFYALVIGIAAFALFFFALKRLPLFEYIALCHMEVVFGILFGIIFAGEHPAWNTYAGAALIIAASLLSQKAKTRVE